MNSTPKPAYLLALQNSDGAQEHFVRYQQTQDAFLKAAATRLSNHQAGGIGPKNVYMATLSPPVHRTAPATGLSRFDELCADGDNILHGPGFTSTQNAYVVSQPDISLKHIEDFYKICGELPDHKRNAWEAIVKVGEVTGYTICKVRHSITSGSNVELTHGWILATGNGRKVDVHCTDAHPMSQAVMNFYTSAYCFGDWPAQPVLEIKNGEVLLASSEILTIEQAPADPVPQESSTELAIRFNDELLNSVESLVAISDFNGVRTLADLFYLQAAILKDGYIDVMSDSNSDVIQVVSELPSAALWLQYVTQYVDDDDLVSVSAPTEQPTH